jgi:hypothetical protein
MEVAKRKELRRDECETGRDRTFQGGKSGGAEKLGVPNGKGPKCEDCKHKGVRVEGEET